MESKNKTKRTFLMFLTLFSINCSYSQNTFEDFINHFPKYEWDSLPSDIVKISKPDIRLKAEEINKYFYNGKMIEKFVKGNTIYTVPAPHIILKDGAYGKGTGGKFMNDGYTKPTQIIPLARVQMNDSIIVLFLYYYFGPIYFEAYTLNIKTKFLLSSVKLYDEDLCDMTTSFLEKGFSIETFKNLCDVDYKISHYYEKQVLLPNGYFKTEEIHNMEESQDYFIGIVNINEKEKIWSEPDSSSTLLYKVNNRCFLYLQNYNSEWYKILWCFEAPKGLQEREFYREGYIQKKNVVRKEKK